MRTRIFLFTALLLCLAAVCSAARFSYTWKDAEGNLHITDFAPPEDAEVLDVRVIPMPEPEQIDPEALQQQRIEQRQDARQEMLARAAQLRKEEKTLREKAANLREEARELRRVAKKLHYKQRNRLRAGLKEDEAAELDNQADGLAREASALEQRAARLK